MRLPTKSLPIHAGNRRDMGELQYRHASRCLSLSAIGSTPATEQGLAAYVGHDLTKLSEAEFVRFDRQLRAITKDEPKEDE